MNIFKGKILISRGLNVPHPLEETPVRGSQVSFVWFVLILFHDESLNHSYLDALMKSKLRFI